MAKRKMQGLNNAVFEELCVDVYDEVDRRETDQVWAATVPKNSRLVCLPCAHSACSRAPPHRAGATTPPTPGGTTRLAPGRTTRPPPGPP